MVLYNNFGQSQETQSHDLLMFISSLSFNYIDCVARDINQGVNDLPNLMSDRIPGKALLTHSWMHPFHVASHLK